MYNLLMVGRDGYWNERTTATFEYDRFLSFTHASIKSEYGKLSENNIAKIAALPTLFAYEFPKRIEGREVSELPPARIGKITAIRRHHDDVEFDFELDENIRPIPTARIHALARELDISLERQESYRTHWAIKDADVIGILLKEGLIEQANERGEVEKLLKQMAVSSDAPRAKKERIFIVHGRDDGLKNEVGRWLSKIGFEDVILHEQPSIGRTLISKFEEVAANISYALVLMTPDDVGGLAGGEQRYRARQNVIFELGYFIGKIGASRVAALVVGDIEKPSDYAGVVYIPYDGPGGWKVMLAREFKALDMSFDLLSGL